MLTEIEKLDADGREQGVQIHAVLQRDAGWGVQWFDNTEEVPPYWRDRLHVYGYYPTIGEMVVEERKRLAALKV